MPPALVYVDVAEVVSALRALGLSDAEIVNDADALVGLLVKASEVRLR